MRKVSDMSVLWLLHCHILSLDQHLQPFRKTVFWLCEY